MNPYTMSVTIVFLVIVGAIFILHQIKAMSQPRQLNSLEKQLRDEIDDLKQRVQVLERIATDRKHDLKDKIDTL